MIPVESRAVCQRLVRRLAAPPYFVRFEAGLSAAELRALESRFAFTLPPDLRVLLQFAMPVGDVRRAPGTLVNGTGFPDWRNLDSPELQKQVAWPIEGVLFDVRDGFWLETWGSRPATMVEAVAIAEVRARAAPKLIPIYAHRYICEQPEAAGNPILSVWQTDVIYYGSELQDYFAREFSAQSTPPERPFSRELAGVPFWSELVDREP
jgi:hypothetical protein